MVPYIFTAVGMFIRQWYVHVISREGSAVTVLTVIAVILTLIGAKMTYNAKGGKRADKKSLVIALSIHGVIWLGGFLLFGAVLWLLDKIVRLIALVIGLVIAGFWFFGSDGSTSEKVGETEEGDGGLSRMPNIMYSDGYTRWQLQYRNYDHVVYQNDEGNSITIRNASVSGGNIQTDQGFFQTYS